MNKKLNLKGSININKTFSGEVNLDITHFKGSINRTMSSGTNNYEKLINLPSINGETLLGNKELSDLGIQEKGEYPDSRITNFDLEELFNDW